MGVLKQCNITNSYYSEPLVCCVDIYICVDLCRYCVDILLGTSSAPNQSSINILPPPFSGRDSVTYGGQQLFITTLHR